MSKIKPHSKCANVKVIKEKTIKKLKQAQIRTNQLINGQVNCEAKGKCGRQNPREANSKGELLIKANTSVVSRSVM